MLSVVLNFLKEKIKYFRRHFHPFSFLQLTEMPLHVFPLSTRLWFTLDSEFIKHSVALYYYSVYFVRYFFISFEGLVAERKFPHFANHH